jgi:hypothetical protein
MALFIWKGSIDAIRKSSTDQRERNDARHFKRTSNAKPFKKSHSSR